MSSGTRMAAPAEAGIVDGFLIFEPLVEDVKSDVNYNFGAIYTESAWDASFLAQVALAEFVKTNWQDISLDGIELPENEAEIKQEIMTLVELSRSTRRDLFRFQEILDQVDGVIDYFAQLLKLSPAQQNTLILMNIAHQAGLMVAMHFKHRFGRPRPQQVFAALCPAIGNPGSAAWPSGHATQCYLIASTLKEVVPDPIHAALDALAKRIGENREIAGVHFPSDTVAGMEIAKRVYPLLRESPTFNRILNAAETEY